MSKLKRKKAENFKSMLGETLNIHLFNGDIISIRNAQ